MLKTVIIMAVPVVLAVLGIVFVLDAKQDIP